MSFFQSSLNLDLSKKSKNVNSYPLFFEVGTRLFPDIVEFVAKEVIAGVSIDMPKKVEYFVHDLYLV